MPAYFTYPTMHDIHKHLTKGEKWIGNWYSQMMAQIKMSLADPLELKVTMSQLLAELEWERNNKPYYSVHPNLVTKLCQVDFTKIPSNLITMPDPFDVVCIRLNQENNLLSIESGKYYLRSMLVARRRKGQVVRHKHHVFEMDQNALIAWMDIGEVNQENNNIPLLTYKCFPINDGEMVENAFDFFPQSPYNFGVKVPDEFVKNCIKLFISVGFLAASESPLLAYDILSKDSHKWLNATEEERQHLIDKAKKKGKFGWLLGTDEIFSSRELRFSHIRTGHPHWYWYGPGKSKLKLRFVAPTTVKKGLPFKPENKNE